MVIKCLYCEKEIRNLHPKRKGCVIRIEFSHSLVDNMWDDMETKYLCSWGCYDYLIKKTKVGIISGRYGRGYARRSKR